MIKKIFPYKKICSLGLSVLLVLSLASPAYAEENGEAATGSAIEEIEESASEDNSEAEVVSEGEASEEVVTEEVPEEGLPDRTPGSGDFPEADGIEVQTEDITAEACPSGGDTEIETETAETEESEGIAVNLADSDSQIICSGTCGRDVPEKMVWELDASNQLHIAGDGAMASYASASETPWQAYADRISVVILGNPDGSGVPTVIGDYVFASCSRLQSLKIMNMEDTLTVGQYAFSGCKMLTELPFSQLVAFGEGAFKGCSALETADLSEDVTDLASYLFYNCTSLGSVTLPSGLTSIPFYAFDGCSALSAIELPETIEELGAYAFYKCSSLETISIPSGLTEIPLCAFSYCDKLTQVDLPYGVKTIGINAFAYDKNLVITVPASVTSLSGNAFSGVLTICGYEGSRAIEYAITNKQNYELLTLAHREDNILSSGTLADKALVWKYWEDGTLNISGSGGMEDYSSASEAPWQEYVSMLSTVILGEEDGTGVPTAIGDYAFASCSRLQFVRITNTEASLSVGQYAFYGCKRLTELPFSQLVAFGEGAFKGCSALETADLSENVTALASYLFYNCTSLRSVTLPSGLTSIPFHAFDGCSALSAIELPETIEELGAYFLIDEFQDTNPMQAEIFFYLAAKQIDSDWKKCIPHPGSLFIVGDPKQSIYRFRDADVGAFQRVKGLFSGSVGEALLLSCNFRSTNEMCRWFNRVFSDLLPEDNADQSKFSEIPIEKAKDPVGTFHGIYSYIRDERKTAKPEMKDTERVLSMVRRLVNNPAYTICGKDGQERKITYGDFMIITPTKTKISEYSDIFIRNRIPFLVEGSTVFSECPALVTLYSLYAAAADPNNRNCLYAALTGNYYCVSRNELIKYVNDGGKLNVFNPCADSINDSAEGDEDDSKSGEDITIEAKENRIEKALLEIRELYFSSKSLTPAALFVKIMDDCHIFEKTGTLNIEYIYYALELLRSGEASGEISSVKEASKFLESLISDEAEIERYLSLSRAKDRIHIANLHKVKGLEAPIVILASPQKKKRSPQMRVDISGENPMGWIFEVSKKKKKDVYESIIKCSDFPKEQEVERISKNAENIRLLYVAATRARNALIVGSYVNAGKPGNYGAENAWLELLKYCERDFFESVPEKNMPSSIDREFVKATDIYADNKDNVFDRYTSGKAGYSIKLPSQIKLKSRLSSEDDYEDIAEEKTDKRRNTNKKRNPALIGTLVHRLMEVLISSKNRADIKASVMEICSEYDADDADGYYRNILMKVGEKIRKGGYTQENGSKTDVLKLLLSAEEVHCEVPFCYRETSNAQNDSAVIWHGVMDVIYKKDGRWHIIDYKTNYEESDLDEKYRGQLQAYIRAFKEMTGEEADAEIYHIEVTE